MTRSTTSTTPTGDWTPEQKRFLNMVFGRLRAIYGTGLMATAYPSVKALRIAEREWANRIFAHSWDALERALERVKRAKERGEQPYPDISTVIQLASEEDGKDRRPEHVPSNERLNRLPKHRDRETARKHLDALREQFGMKPKNRDA